MKRLVAFAAAFAAFAAGCSSYPPARGTAFVPSDGAGIRDAASPVLGKYVKHVVVIIQENRTFDNLFEGFPGADTQPFGYRSNGRKVYLKPTQFDPGFNPDMVHNYAEAVVAWHGGKMDRFNETPFDDGQKAQAFPYSYIERSEIAPYWTLAQTYAIADHMFPTEFGPSFTSHLNLIAGTNELNPQLAEANYPAGEPWGCDAPSFVKSSTVGPKRVVKTNGPWPCFAQFATIADSLDAKRVPWRFYAPALDVNGGQLWSSFDAIQKVRCASVSNGQCAGHGADWKNVLSPQTRVLGDARAGRLAAVTWVVPDWQDSDHPAATSDTGPSWVANVVNAIGEGPDWKSTVVFLLWDDWGGWYDNVPPPALDFRGLGIRVPLVIISPYARKGYVDKTVYESASLLKFIEKTFGTPPIGPASEGYTDTRAALPLAAFDFTQRPRTFAPVAVRYPASYFLTRPPSYHAVDDQ